jgi:PAS domain S-box-containing protein
MASNELSQNIQDEALRVSTASAGNVESQLTVIGQKLEADQQLGLKVAEALPIPLLITGVGEGKVLFANAALEETFGYKRDGLIGRNWSCLIPKLTYRKRLEQMARQELRVRGLTVEGRRKDGQKLWLSLWQQRAVCQGVESLLTILADVTEEKLETKQREQQEETLQQLLTLADRDRELIACDIHDGIIQDMTGALMHLEAVRRGIRNGSPDVDDQVQSIMQMLRDGINEARRLIDGVRPPDLDRFGLAGAIQSLIDRTMAAKKIQIQFQHKLRGPRLSEQAETALYRIAQECLNNVWQHSRSSQAAVKLSQNDRSIRLVVRDWGVGFSPQDVGNARFGLAGIRQRARLMGGRALIRSSPSKGCVVSVTLPLDKAGTRSRVG